MMDFLADFFFRTPVGNYFFAGFCSGFFGYLFYKFVNLDGKNDNQQLFAKIYGAFLTAVVGGIMAIIFDQSIELALFVGLFAQFIYVALMNGTKTAKLLGIIKEVVIKFLTK